MSKGYMFVCLYITKIALVQSVLWETGLGDGIRDRDTRMKGRKWKRKVVNGSCVKELRLIRHNKHITAGVLT
jgi:hypothetical protein